MAGSLIPPSYVVCFPHRNGPLSPPGTETQLHSLLKLKFVYDDKMKFSRGLLRFELDRGVPLEPHNPYPSLRVILAKKGTHF